MHYQELYCHLNTSQIQMENYHFPSIQIYDGETLESFYVRDFMDFHIDSLTFEQQFPASKKMIRWDQTRSVQMKRIECHSIESFSDPAFTKCLQNMCYLPCVIWQLIILYSFEYVLVPVKHIPHLHEARSYILSF